LSKIISNTFIYSPDGTHIDRLTEKINMRRSLIPATIVLSFILSNCTTKDKKNEGEPYPTYDTTSKMENKNSAPVDSSSLNVPKDHGDIH
jgi:hypothetical protein